MKRMMSKATIMCLCPILLVASGCKLLSPGSSSSTSTSSPSNDTKSSPGAVSSSDSPQDVLKRAARAERGSKSFHVHGESTVNGSTRTVLLDYVAPDRFHLSIQSKTGEQVSEEMIIIGKDAWKKKGNENWTKLPMELSGSLAKFAAQMVDTKVLDEKANGMEVKLVGPDTLEGMPTLVYEFTARINVGEENSNEEVILKSSGKAWVSSADGMLRKVDSENESEGAKSKSVSTYTDYNSNIKIEPPM